MPCVELVRGDLDISSIFWFRLAVCLPVAKVCPSSALRFVVRGVDWRIIGDLEEVAMTGALTAEVFCWLGLEVTVSLVPSRCWSELCMAFLTLLCWLEKASRFIIVEFCDLCVSYCLRIVAERSPPPFLLINWLNLLEIACLVALVFGAPPAAGC